MPAQAGLSGTMVIANSWFGGADPQPVECNPQGNATCALVFSNNVAVIPVAPPLDLGEDFLTLTTPTITDTQITIVNALPAVQFCTTTNLPCPDAFDGWVFTFLGAQSITSVKVDASSTFSPATLKIVNNNTVNYNTATNTDPNNPNYPFTQYTGNSIYVNLVGATGATLVLDVTTGGTPPPPVPEPSTWMMMGLGFAGLGWAGWRRRRSTRAA